MTCAGNKRDNRNAWFRLSQISRHLLLIITNNTHDTRTLHPSNHPAHFCSSDSRMDLKAYVYLFLR